MLSVQRGQRYFIPAVHKCHLHLLLLNASHLFFLLPNQNVEAMKKDTLDAGITEQPLARLRVDGRMTHNKTLMQMLADVLGNIVGM